MIFVTDEMYAEIASRFFGKLEKSGNYFNGRIEYDTPEFYSTLTCSAVLYRSVGCGAGLPEPAVEKVVPVWWEFTACAGGVPQEHDFSWSELAAFFPVGA